MITDHAKKCRMAAATLRTALTTYLVEILEVELLVGQLYKQVNRCVL
jgi:hypothetical protein